VNDSDSTAQTGEHHPARLVGPRRAPFVRISIALTSVLVIAMVGVLVYRAIRVVQPSVVLIRADQHFSGATVQAIDLDGRIVRSGKIARDSDFMVSLPLPPGSYTIELIHDGQTRQIQQVFVKDKQHQAIDITPIATSRP
jgi:hypothetical protein